MRTFQELLQEAIADIVDHGFDSEARVADWQERLRAAAARQYGGSNSRVEDELRAALGQVYQRMVEKYGILRHHPGIQRWTIDRVKPKLRAELDRRIMASANLIKLNRQESIDRTLRRFSGWATSIPASGTDAAHRGEVKAQIRKSLAGLPFSERRVAIDQGHKLVASINEVIANDNGAIAVEWKSHWRQAGYNYRPDHKERDGKIYAIKGAWAYEKGLAKVGEAGWYSDVTAVAEEPFCRCYGRWIYSLGSLPLDMLTQKGKDELARVREMLRTKRNAA